MGSLKTPWYSFWILYSFCPLYCNSYLQGCFERISIGAGLRSSAFWLVEVFVVISSFWKEKFPQWGRQATCICGYKNKCLGCCQRLCWFSKVVVINNISLMGLNTYWARELPCLVLVPGLLLCTSEVMDMRKFILFSSVSRD